MCYENHPKWYRQVVWVRCNAEIPDGKEQRNKARPIRAALKKLRNLDGYTSAPAYLYSAPMKALPSIPDTDFFFKASGPAKATAPAATGARSLVP